MKKNDLEQIRQLVGQHLLAGLQAGDGTAPRASFLNTCVSFLKRHSDFVADVNKPDAEEVRDRLRATLTDKDGRPLKLPFLLPGHEGYVPADDQNDDFSADDEF
jgi:hypothetical protein